MRCRGRYRWVRRVASDTDIGELRQWEVVLVGPTDRPKWAILLCPCGCGEDIHVNLMRSHHPHWSMSCGRGNKVSFYPSLCMDRNRCGSHFFLIQGRVIWYDSIAEEL